MEVESEIQSPLKYLFPDLFPVAAVVAVSKPCVGVSSESGRRRAKLYLPGGGFEEGSCPRGQPALNRRCYLRKWFFIKGNRVLLVILSFRGKEKYRVTCRCDAGPLGAPCLPQPGWGEWGMAGWPGLTCPIQPSTSQPGREGQAVRNQILIP